MTTRNLRTKLLSGAAALLAFVNLAAHAQAIDPQQLRQMLMQRLGQHMPPAEAPATPRPTTAQTTEAALAQQVAAWPAATGPFAVERFRDGFAINGERILDPEGEIVQYAVDSSTGDAAYLMQVQPDQFLIKLMRVGTAPLTLGSATKRFGQWSLETISGVRAAGARLNITPRGFVLGRDNALFRYVVGTGMRSHALPETHMLAAHQNGDVGGTGWLLLEKRIETKQSEGGVLAQGSLGELLGTVKQLGTVLGVNKSDSDYALYSLDTRKMLPIGIALGDKNTNLLSQCRARNRWVSQCDRLDTVQSLYAQDGAPNRSHYHWRLAWFKSSRGPLAVVMEDGITTIDAIELSTERRVNLFQRTLGIAGWSASQSPDGRVQVKAQLGLEAARLDDVVSLFDASSNQTAQK